MTRICPTCSRATVLDHAGGKPVQLCPPCNLIIDGLHQKDQARWSGPPETQPDYADPEYTHESLANARDGLAEALRAAIPGGRHSAGAYSDPVTE